MRTDATVATMRLTITLEPDVRTLVEPRMRERRESFRTVVNEALRAGLGGGGRRETPMPTFDMGEPMVELDKALALAGAIEDDERERLRVAGAAARSYR